MRDTSAFQRLPEWQRARNQYEHARTWPEAVTALGNMAAIEGLPLIYGENEASGLWVRIGNFGPGVGGLTDCSFYEIGEN